VEKKEDNFLEKPYNSRIIDVYLRLIKLRYPLISQKDLLNQAGIKDYEIHDQGHWFSQDQVDRFHEISVSLTGNPNIAREAGRYALNSETNGLIRRYLISFLGPMKAYETIEKSARLLTKSTEYKFHRINNHSVEFRVTPREGINEKKYQCENRLGTLEAVALAFTNKIPQINHTECIFKGDKSCRYCITWEQSITVPLRRFRYLIMIGIGFINMALFPFMKIVPWSYMLLGSALSATLLSIYAIRNDNHTLRMTLEELRQTTDDLLFQTKLNYNNSTLSQEVGQAISQSNRTEEVLNSITSIFERRLDFDRGMILLADEQKNELIFQTGFGYTRQNLHLMKLTKFRLDRDHSQGVFILCFKEQKSFIINDLTEIQNNLSDRSLSFARALGTHSFICCPIVCDGQSLGILAVDNRDSHRPLLNSDLNFLQGMTSVISMSIKNTRLLKAREEQFESIIQVLASSIDARDNLTAGHSEKVMEYSLAISREMGLTEDFQDMIKIAALLHDYGKIGIPDSILKKPGHLTEDEFTSIKTHANRTYDILHQIPFTGMFERIPEIAASHHERLDGMGYPYGLKGTEIPLGARIIAVADFFEAITSHRHYRKPMSRDRAIRLMIEEADSHLDRDIIEYFLTYLQRTGIGEELGVESLA